MAEVKKLKTREEIDSKYKWNIEKVYKDSQQWEKDFKQLKVEALKLKEFPGTLSDPKNLISYLNLKEKISRKTEVLFVYAHLKSDEDTTNTEFQTLKEKIDSYLAELSSINAFFVPEILSLNEDDLLKNIDEIQELNMYKFFFKQIIIMKPHTLSRELEEMLASVSDCLEAPGNIFSMLTNADMTFPNIRDENNNEVELTEVNYATFIRSKDRRVREEAFKALFNTYSKFKNTLTSSLTSSVKNFIFVSKANKYESSLESSLKPNNIPLEVYHKSIDTINKNLDSLHRYVRVKKRLLGLDEMHMYDLYVPVIDIPKEHIEFEKAVEIVKEGLKPLGEEYLNIFKEGIDNGWVDVFENKGKRGGAYSWGCHDTMPYVLLNYNYSINDVSTFAHEMGHSIHSYYSRKNQPQLYSNYTLFCAEVASTTNEALLIHHLINKEEDENRKLYLINQELEQIRTTVFRQLMFAEFEILVHESIEKGNPLNSRDLCGMWHDLNVKYFGPDMIVDEGIDMEWARIPHFYSDFYVYQYATGYAAASAFAKTMLENNENALEKYKGFLKSGGSDYPINILKTAGVDMTTSKPLEATIARFNELLDMLEK